VLPKQSVTIAFSMDPRNGYRGVNFLYHGGSYTGTVQLYCPCAPCSPSAVLLTLLPPRVNQPSRPLLDASQDGRYVPDGRGVRCTRYSAAPHRWWWAAHISVPRSQPLTISEPAGGRGGWLPH
jgi:hypothetical protein